VRRRTFSQRFKIVNPKLQILKLSREVGFHSAGVARLERNSEGFRRFEEWLRRGYHGEMAYLPRGAEKRADPDLILKGARSLLVLSWDYGEKTRTERGSPFISRYAWGEDYHRVLGEKVKVLEKRLAEAFPNALFKGYVDTGPVMEKYWASLAGQGWIGKHTNVIHPERGSYFFLTCLFTDLELKPDPPVSDHCGRCTDCIDVCPTRAIVAPYVLDARRCISYLTIELKGSIPRELRPGIGAHVFGCDDCQEVCPWNRQARLPEEFLRNPPVEELIEYLSLSPKDFKKRFQESPVSRAKRKGFLRNVCVVLGNLKDPRALPALTKALEDPEPLIRAHAAWALGRFKEKAAEKSLQERKKMEDVEWVRGEIEEALFFIHPLAS
jgi:epoxyqueuosine reductase